MKTLVAALCLFATVAHGEELLVYADLTEATGAAISALDQHRLSHVRTTDGEKVRVIRGEMSRAAGALYNSYGGFGEIALQTDFPGSKRLRVEIKTRSAAASEPVGGLFSALKGYNYNDPSVAASIADAMRARLPSPTDADLAQDALAKERYLASVQADLDRYRRAKEGAAVICSATAQCDKAFALAQIYIADTADMKIQLATNFVVETFNADGEGKISMKAVRMPLQGDDYEIRLTVFCRSQSAPSLKACNEREFLAYEGFRGFVTARLR